MNDFAGFNPQKDWMREEVMEVIRSSSSLMWNSATGKLLVHWAGLAGKEGQELAFLIARNFLTMKSKCICIDHDVRALADCRNAFVEAAKKGLCEWRGEDALVFARNIISGDLKEGDEHLRRIGVFVYDSMSRLDSAESALDTLIELGKVQSERLGEFVLAFNFTDLHATKEIRDGYEEWLRSRLTSHGFQPGQKLFERYDAKGGSGSMYFTILTFGFEDNRMFSV